MVGPLERALSRCMLRPIHFFSIKYVQTNGRPVTQGKTFEAFYSYVIKGGVSHKPTCGTLTQSQLILIIHGCGAILYARPSDYSIFQ